MTPAVARAPRGGALPAVEQGRRTAAGARPGVANPVASFSCPDEQRLGESAGQDGEQRPARDFSRWRGSGDDWTEVGNAELRFSDAVLLTALACSDGRQARRIRRAGGGALLRRVLAHSGAARQGEDGGTRRLQQGVAGSRGAPLYTARVAATGVAAALPACAAQERAAGQMGSVGPEPGLVGSAQRRGWVHLQRRKRGRAG
uniref:Uncharacterized protein n=1 Tax=Setaria viridis TaxID=4556 RepID=A0A4U6VPW0_SETVI|nr:hypothetical protein SEVIR_2G060900v2 [Setaria viridis]